MTTKEQAAAIAVKEFADRYRSRYGFDVTMNRHGRILLRTGIIDAIQMPSPLGNHVRKLLSEDELRSPITENTRTGYLTFLTAPAPPEDRRPVHLLRGIEADGDRSSLSQLLTQVELFRLAAIRTVDGAELALPGPDDPIRRWLVPPGGPLMKFDRLTALTITAGTTVSGRRTVRP